MGVLGPGTMIPSGKSQEQDVKDRKDWLDNLLDERDKLIADNLQKRPE